ncbi:hypothetical protein [Streptomyces sp. NPDC002788]
MHTPQIPTEEPIYSRTGDFAVFNQLGVKLAFSDDTTDEEYYAWLDEMHVRIGDLVPGGEIAEKSYARTEPRLNTGIYYDTEDHRLLRAGAVLRTTCNIKTHAFCAFKLSEDENSVRRDHRYVFEGEDKANIQRAPSSPEAVAAVKRLLARTDIEHPGVHLREKFGITGDDLTPAIGLEQYRHPFFVWLDKRDALRCSMDRVTVYDLRLPEEQRVRKTYSEIELPVYPHLEDEVAHDPRLIQLIETLTSSLEQRFGIQSILESKYQRAADVLGIPRG